MGLKPSKFLETGKFCHLEIVVYFLRESSAESGEGDEMTPHSFKMIQGAWEGLKFFLDGEWCTFRNFHQLEFGAEFK